MWLCSDTVYVSNPADPVLFSIEQGFSFPVTFSLPKPSRLLVPLSGIVSGGRIFRLTVPIVVELCAEDGAWLCEYKPFSILSFGASPQQSVFSFFEDFAVLWDEIAEARDETLAGDALRVKQELRSAVKEVLTEPARCR
jgi:hypothetical protein